MWFDELKTPIGTLQVACDDSGLRYVLFENKKYDAPNREDWKPDKSITKEARQQLLQYFAGERETFDLQLNPSGTEFQMQTWNMLAKIPFGETWSYSQLANKMGSPKAVRAVGAANGRNPIPIILPCHRVIGSNGTLTGFGGGLPTKQWLLEHEGIKNVAQASLGF